MSEGSEGDTQEAKAGTMIGVGIAIGAGAGVAIGVALGNIALGIPIGMVIGVAIGAGLEQRQRREREDDGVEGTGVTANSDEE